MGRSGYTCVRHVFCSLNVLMWLCGCGLLGAGVWLRLSYEGYYSPFALQYSLISADSLFIAAGVIMFIVAFFGCCGAWYQSRWMLIAYFSLVVITFLLEFLLATLAFAFRERLAVALRRELEAGISQHYRDDPDDSLFIVWSHIHSEFHCCGVNDYTDWYNIMVWPEKNYVPQSCCKPELINGTDCGRMEPVIPEQLYTKGCAEQVQMWFVEHLHIIGIVGLVIAFIQLFGLIASMLLFCTVRHKRSSHAYKAYNPNS